MIVDDMPLAIASLRAEIEDHFSDDIFISATAEGIVDAAKKIRKSRPDVIFLDIHMGDGDGFDLLDVINREGIEIVFTTASKDHAIKAFQYSVADYLLKPVTARTLKKSVLELKKKLSDRISKGRSENSRIILKTQDEVKLVDYEKIIRLEAMGNYTRFHLLYQRNMLLTKTLKSYEVILADHFLRVHQSHLVNCRHIKAFKKLDNGILIMSNGDEVPVSVRKRSVVSRFLSTDKK